MKKFFVFVCAIIIHLECLPQNTTIQDLKDKLEKSADTEEKILTLHDLVRTLASSKPDAALDFGLQSVKLATKSKNQKLLANSYNNVGAVYQLMGNLKLAADYNYKALHIRESIGDSLGLSTSYNNIGNINNYLEAYDKARNFYERALHIASKINNKEAISRALNNLGYSYEIQDNIAKAIQFYEQGLVIKEEIGDKVGLTVSVINLGDLHLKSGNIKKGINYLHRGLLLAQETEHLLNIAYAYRGLAEAYQQQGNLSKAAEFALLSLGISKKHGAYFEIINSADVLNNIYLELGNYSKAHHFLSLSSAYKDSLHNKSSRQQIEELQVKYETEKKEKENIQLAAERDAQERELENQKKVMYLLSAFLLSFVTLAFVLFKGKQQFRKISQALSQQQAELLLQATQLQEQTDLLEKTNQVKDKLFSIVAHDLRGPLVSLSGMTRMLRMGAVPENKREHFLNLIESDQQNSLWLMDNLFLWAKSQMRGAKAYPEQLDLYKLAEENIKLLKPQADKKAVKLENNIKNISSAFADREMIKLVLRNLISNAIKFCNSDDSVTVSATQENSAILISVKDTGVGISAENKAKLFGSTNYTCKGTANEKGSGLGLQLCKDFVSLNGGAIWVESEAGNGSTFYFTLPVAK